MLKKMEYSTSKVLGSAVQGLDGTLIDRIFAHVPSIADAIKRRRKSFLISVYQVEIQSYFNTNSINSFCTFQSFANFNIAVASISVTYPFRLLACHTMLINSVRLSFG